MTHANAAAELCILKILHSRTIPAAQPTALLATILHMVQCAAFSMSLYASKWYWKQPYHTSALTGEWVEELIYSHPNNCLGMRATEL